MKITLADGKTINNLGETMFNLEIEKISFAIKCLVVESLSQELILGTDFWIKSGIILDIAKNQWRFSEQIEVATLNAIKGHPELNIMEKEALGKISSKQKNKNLVICRIFFWQKYLLLLPFTFSGRNKRLFLPFIFFDRNKLQSLPFIFSGTNKLQNLPFIFPEETKFNICRLFFPTEINCNTCRLFFRQK